MAFDFLGNAVTTDNHQAIAAWNDTIRGVLAHAATTPGSLKTTLVSAPDFALPHAAQGLMMLMLARRELVASARAAHHNALGRARDDRERAYVAALGSWLDGEPLGAADTLDSVAETAPQDALAVKLAHQIRFMAGDTAGMLAGLTRQAPAFAGTEAEAAVLGCHAFALEEAGRYQRAELVGRQALALDPNDAWGRHAVAHVLEMTGRSREGAAWLSATTEHWAHSNNFGFHLHWHHALFLMEEGRNSEALGLYDHRIRASHTDDFRDIANAAALLARLEFEGIAVGDRWQELADFAGARVDDGCLVFADLHYALALAGANRFGEAGDLVVGLVDRGREPSGSDDRTAGTVGARVAEAVLAFRMGAYGKAADLLWSTRAHLPEIGGSHAQRDLFEQMLIESAIRSGQIDRADFLLTRRLDQRGGHNAFAARRLARLAATSISPAIGLMVAASLPAAIAH